MQDFAAAPPDTAALLSAATTGSGLDGEIPALLDIGGEPVISHQIRVLRQFGIDRFFIEVDQVPGQLLAACDKARQNGASIEFVRSPQELAQKLPLGASLFAVAEGVVADPKLIAEMTASETPFIATIDGREENNAYERMDLNTRWAGVARFNRSTVSSVASLPDGWSIASSLLRQAMQQGIAQKPLKQVQLQDQKLCLVAAPEDADAMTAKLLSVRAAKGGGVVESSLFGAAAKWIAPRIWRNEAAKKAVPIASGLAALGSVALGWFGHDALAAVSALLSIFGLSVMTTMTARDEGGLLRRFAAPAVWTSLAVALGAALWEYPQNAMFALFPAVMLAGLMVHARQVELPKWAHMVLASPALAIIILLFFALFDRLATGATLLSTGYLVALIAARLWLKREAPVGKQS